MKRAESFQDIILMLNDFWRNKGCIIMQPYDMEMGAGTFHPATSLLTLGNKPLRVAYVQPSRRPADGRYGENPNRLYHFNQYQVLLKPSPDDIVELYLESLKYIGIDSSIHDIRFVEDDWESPTLGAWGLGWEVWCDGMEVSQFTYMQQIAGIDLNPITGELTYGLERLAMYLQAKEDVYELAYNKNDTNEFEYKYGDLFKEYERQMSTYCKELANTDVIKRQFTEAEDESLLLHGKGLYFAAYEQCIKASNYFNILDARGVISVNERANYIARVRAMAKNCAELYYKVNYNPSQE